MEGSTSRIEAVKRRQWGKYISICLYTYVLFHRFACWGLGDRSQSPQDCAQRPAERRPLRDLRRTPFGANPLGVGGRGVDGLDYPNSQPYSKRACAFGLRSLSTVADVVSGGEAREELIGASHGSLPAIFSKSLSFQSLCYPMC